MYKEIEEYLNKAYAKIEKGLYNSGEYDTLPLFLKELRNAKAISEEEFKSWDSKIQCLYAKRIETLGLNTRAYNCLMRAGIHNYGELRKRLLGGVNEDFFSIRNLGEVTAHEIIESALCNHIITKEEIMGSQWNPVCLEKLKVWFATRR